MTKSKVNPRKGEAQRPLMSKHLDIAIKALEEQRQAILEKAQAEAAEIEVVIHNLMESPPEGTGGQRPITVRPGQFKNMEMWAACTVYFNDHPNISVPVTQMAVDLAAGGQKTLADCSSPKERLRRLRICLGHHEDLIVRDERNDTVKLLELDTRDQAEEGSSPRRPRSAAS